MDRDGRTRRTDADIDDAGELAQSGAAGRERELHRRRSTGTNPTGNVGFSSDGDAIGGCTAVALTGSGNSKTAVCTTSSLATGSHSIVASYTGDAGNTASASASLARSHHRRRGVGSNVALASAGGVATASSTYSRGLPGERGQQQRARRHAAGDSGGGWADGTPGTFPDWVQIAFNGSKTIDRVVVYTLQDNFNQPVEPTDSTTFATYGITAFTVQGWNGTSWITLATVSGNTLVKRTVSFAPTTTDRIRVNVTAARGAVLYTHRDRGLDRDGRTRRTGVDHDHARELAQSGASRRERHASPRRSPAPIPPATSASPTTAMRSAVAPQWRSPAPATASTAACSTSSLAVGHATRIVASYAGDAGNTASASAPLSQVVSAAGALGSNVALASAGGVASASSTYAPAYPVSAINNNERAGTGWDNGGGWADGTPGTFPDWVQITFNGSKTIDRVVVYSLQDNYTQPVEPTRQHDLCHLRHHRLHRAGLERDELDHSGHGQRQQRWSSAA